MLKKAILIFLMIVVLSSCDSTSTKTDSNQSKSNEQQETVKEKADDKKIDYNSKIKDPKYENASTIGDTPYIFYEDDEIFGIDMGGVGTFIYNYKDEKLTTAYFLDIYKETDLPIAPIVQMSKDKKSLFLTYESVSDGTYYKTFKYNIKDKTIEEVKKVSKEEIFDSKLFIGEDGSLRHATEKGNNSPISELSYKPIKGDKEYYPFKNIK